MSELTPYDTGERLEPKPWVPYTLGNGDPEDERDDYGKVDYDNDEGTTVATVWVERTSAGQYTVHVRPLLADESRVTIAREP